MADTPAAGGKLTVGTHKVTKMAPPTHVQSLEIRILRIGGNSGFPSTGAIGEGSGDTKE